jgi:hypothetical protein
VTDVPEFGGTQFSGPRDVAFDDEFFRVGTHVDVSSLFGQKPRYRITKTGLASARNERWLIFFCTGFLRKFMDMEAPMNSPVRACVLESR